MGVRKRTDANERAEEAYRSKFEQVLVRLTPAEAKAIDAARGEFSRPEYLKDKGLAAAQRWAAKR